VLQTLVKTVIPSVNVRNHISSWHVAGYNAILGRLYFVTSRSSSNIQQISLATAQRSDCLSTNTHPSRTFNALFGVRLALTSSKQRAYQHKLDQLLIFDCSIIGRSFVFLNGFDSLSTIRVIDFFFLLVLTFFLLEDGRNEWKKRQVENNKINVQKFSCCDCVDWIVNDWLAQRDDVAHISGKLPPPSVQLISH
jgi:hypothetical protein